MEWTAILWLVLLAVLLLMEASTVTLVSIWFAFGALAAMIVSLLGGQLWLQAAVFVVVSAVLLAALRPLARKHFTPKLVKTNVDAVLGQTGYVVEPIDNIKGTGRVKLGGMEWSARSTEEAPVEADTLVKVDRVEGVKVFVTPVKGE